MVDAKLLQVDVIPENMLQLFTNIFFLHNSTQGVTDLHMDFHTPKLNFLKQQKLYKKKLLCQYRKHVAILVLQNIQTRKWQIEKGYNV